MTPPPLQSALDPADAALLREALALAAESIGLTDPNPRVGCVIASRDGRVLGRGRTQAAGSAHAEVMALRDATARGEAVQGSVVYVTMEPCAHQGRTPPCCEALIAAGIGRVVCAIGDPNPLVAGRGISALRAAGIRVDEAGPGDLQAEALDINIGFFSRMERGRPWVRMKAAASIDGRTALPDGTSQWITGEAARRDGHRYRKRAGAVLTGVGTVLADDPRLDVRLVPTQLQPRRVVVDSRLRTPPAARILQPPGQALVYTASSDPDRMQALADSGVEVVTVSAAEGGVDLDAVLADLAERGTNEVHLEAGPALNGAFMRLNLVDEWLIYVAPLLLGPGPGIATFPALARLEDAVRLQWVDMGAVGGDLRLVARRSA